MFAVLIILGIIAGFIFVMSIAGMLFIDAITAIKNDMQNKNWLLMTFTISGSIIGGICVIMFCYLAYEILKSAIQNLF